MTMETVLAELQKSIPGYQVDPEWLSDGNTYLAFGDFARFICSEAEVLQYVHSEEEASELSRVGSSMSFLERALRDGDSDVQGLVFDCVETLASCDWINQIKKYFGSRVSDLWAHHFSEPRK